MPLFIKGAVVVALLGVLLGIMELVAKVYLVHGLRVTPRAPSWAISSSTTATTHPSSPSVSNLYFVTWQGVRRILYCGIQRLEKRYLAAIGVKAPQGQDERWAGSKSRRIEIWKKYIHQQRQVERTRGVPAYSFLQPNQYLKHSKPVSVEERAPAINSEVADIMDAQISLLRGAAQDLASEGVPVFDLTGIFHETPATVYVDACCHLNERGNQIIPDSPDQLSC